MLAIIPITIDIITITIDNYNLDTTLATQQTSILI